MKKTELPITERARTYGYVIWRKKHDEEMDGLLGKHEQFEIEIAGSTLKGKTADRKQRRISIGYRLTRALDRSLRTFIIDSPKPAKIRILFR